MADNDISYGRDDIASPASKYVGFLLTQGFPLLSFATLIESMRAANTLSGKPLYRWSQISTDGKAACASNGLEFAVDHAVGTDEPFDYVFVCAGGNPALFQHQPTFRWLRKLVRRKVKLGGLSGGPYLLARAGILDGYRFTIHWEHAPAFLEEFPDLDLRRSLYEIDRDRLTTSGGSSALDMMHAVIAREHGAELAIAVSDWFLQTHVREAGGPQRMPLRERLGVTSAPLLRAVGLMEGTTDKLLSRDQLAQAADVSVRQLERLFKQHLGCSPYEHYSRVRLQRGRDLLRQTSLPIIEIAMACCFSDASHFSYAYKLRYGHSPKFERSALKRPRDQISQ